MTSSLQIILSLLTAIGLGGVFGAYFQSKFQQKMELENEEHKWKRKRYASIIIQMLTVLRFEKHGIRFVKEHRPELNSKEDYLEEIKSEFLYGIVMMNDDVINSLADFLKKQNYQSYTKAVIAMRKDLWGNKSKVKEKSISDIIDI